MYYGSTLTPRATRYFLLLLHSPMLPRRCCLFWPSSAVSNIAAVPSLSCSSLLFRLRKPSFFPRFSSTASDDDAAEKQQHDGDSSKMSILKSGLYLVATPIGNLEDITLRALRVLKSANVILTEDTRHSRKLLQYYNIKTPLLSYHKFNESERETTILKRLQHGDIVALISDAGTPCVSDPGFELAKLCTRQNIPVIPIPGPSALLAAISASGLPTNEFTFVGFLPKRTGSRKERLMVSANETATQIFFVPPHKLHQFLDEASSIFGDSRSCAIAREMTKLHEEFWRGTLGEANKIFSTQQPRGEITLLIEGKAKSVAEVPADDQLELELRELISNGHSISMAVKLVAEGTSAKRKHIYALALRLCGKQMEAKEYPD
ncbi:ribosomal RNA small subunit methyltransferase I [Phoenix dactylifera]|uniref:Ribosomal RNA small subunit methyltransferase I n=1 Tax=Phoenix dactylifera TaxID=42345 RepID=A0A8B7BFC1_PHODC|nr:ribosomal RNA small subunit methyltransferase I [Phoenix dactylifera]